MIPKNNNKNIPWGFVVDKRDANGITLLMEAARQNLPAKILECLAQGSDIDATDKSGLTPLMHALEGRGASDAAVLLANKGADLTLKNKRGMNALMMACFYADGATGAEVIETLIKNNSPLDERDNIIGRTALLNVIRNNNIWAACRLIRAGADYSDAQDFGRQNFSGKDFDYFEKAITEAETRKARAAAEKIEQRERTIHNAVILQQPIRPMKKLVIKKPNPPRPPS